MDFDTDINADTTEGVIRLNYEQHIFERNPRPLVGQKQTLLAAFHCYFRASFIITRSFIRSVYSLVRPVAIGLAPILPLANSLHMIEFPRTMQIIMNFRMGKWGEKRSIIICICI